MGDAQDDTSGTEFTACSLDQSHFGRVICCLPGKISYFKHLLLFSTVDKHEQASYHLFCLYTPEHLPGPCKPSAWLVQPGGSTRREHPWVWS